MKLILCFLLYAFTANAQFIDTAYDPSTYSPAALPSGDIRSLRIDTGYFIVVPDITILPSLLPARGTILNDLIVPKVQKLIKVAAKVGMAYLKKSPVYQQLQTRIELRNK